MADPDLPIKGGTRSSRPWDKGVPVLKFFFPPFGPQFGLKVRGGGSSPGPSPGSATVLVTTPDSPPLSYRRLVWVNVACVFNWVISRKVEREQKNVGRGRERGKEETFPSLPSPFSLILLFCSPPNFLDDLTVAWVSGVSGEKGKDGSEKGRVSVS